jgi:hypothetical protein
VSARGVRRDLPATLSKEREENATIHTCNGPNFVFFNTRKNDGGRERRRGEERGEGTWLQSGRRRIDEAVDGGRTVP